MQQRVTRKWRPSLALLISAVLGLVLCLATAGLFLFQFYTHQLIQQTEESLLAQAALLAETYAEGYAEADDGVPRGKPAPALPRAENPYDPIAPRLSLSQSEIPPPRSDARPAGRTPDPIYSRIGPRLTHIAGRAQLRNLAGYRALDVDGTVIGGTGEVGLSLAHVPEIERALAGEVVSLLRHRESEGPIPPLYSISRGTKVRVFVAMPVVVGGRVVGAVYLSRTPNNIVRYLYAQRANLVLAGIVVLICTALIGFLFWRFVSRPLHGLIRRVDSIASGDPQALQPLPHYGTSEMAKLGQNLLNMARTLTDRQQAVQTFTAHVTHELKSPLTSVTGAAELLLDQYDRMTEAERTRFLTNIARDGQRMTLLLERLRDLAEARLPVTDGVTRLADVVPALARRFPEVDLVTEAPQTPIPMAPEGLAIALTHLIENSLAHGAGQVRLAAAQGTDGVTLDIVDDGGGISPANRSRILEPFFTTRRDEGGTGMGLTIVASMLAGRGGRVEILDAKKGAVIRLHFGEG